jgi:outer membrane receptor for ferrienterochelin and colicins
MNINNILRLFIIITSSLNFLSPAFGEEASRMEDVVVTGTRTERQISKAPVRTEVVSREKIDQSKSRNLADAVEFTNGVRVEDNCQNCNFSQIRLNGLPGSFTQILFDSQPTMSSLAAVYGIEQVPSRLIERIEIVKGGASSLYGPGAIGGVVNIIPYEPTKTGGSIEYRYELMDSRLGGENGSNHGSNGTLDYVSEDGFTLGTLFFQTDSVEPVDLTGDGFTEVSTRELITFGGRLTRYLWDRDAKFVAMYTRSDEYRRGGDNVIAPPTEALLAEEIDTSRNELSATFTHNISPTFDYRLNSSFAFVKRSSYYGADGNPNAFGDTENPLTNFDSQFNHYGSLFGEHVISWGVQRRDEYIEDNLPGVKRFIDEHYFYTGAYFQDEYSPYEELTLIGGVRFDKHSELSDIVASPRGSIKYLPFKELTVRANVSTGFRAPQVFDEDLHLAIIGGEGTVIRNAPDLKEERSVSYQVGAEWLPPISNESIVALFEANSFYTDIRDSFFVDPDDDLATNNQFEFTRINRGGAQVYGVEVNSGLRFDRQISFDAGMVFQKALFDEPDNDFGTRMFFRTPERYGVLSFSWKNNDIVDAFVGLKYTGPMVARHFAGFIETDRLETTPSFVTVDASLSRSIKLNSFSKAVTFTVGARNLTDEYQDDIDQGPRRDSSYTYGPRFPRSFYVTAGYEF